MKFSLEAMIFLLDAFVRILVAVMALVALLAVAVNVPLGH